MSRFKGERVKITSGCTLEPKDESYAVITRTNAKIIENLAEYDDDYRLVKRPESIFDTAISLHFWLNGEFDKITNPSFEYLKKFRNKVSLDKYIEETNSLELKSSLSIAQRYKKGIFPIYKKARMAYKGPVDEYGKPIKREDERIFLVSAHTSKGLEFDSVELEDDFPKLTDIYAKIEDTAQQIAEEANIYYVATTRAKFNLADNTKNDELFC